MRDLALASDCEERAAIMEFDGGKPRAEAETEARRIISLNAMASNLAAQAHPPISPVSPAIQLPDGPGRPSQGDCGLFDGVSFGQQLRPYQLDGIAKIEAALRAGKRRVIFYLPTGAGKTQVAAEILSRAKRKQKRAAFVCNRIELVEQASQRFHSLGIAHGVIQGDNTRAAWSDVTVCSIQTIIRRGMGDIDLAIIDEAHSCANSQAYHKMFEKWGKIPIIGLTATPFSKGLGKHFEEIVVGATISELIASGHLVDCDIYAPSEPDLKNVKIVAGDYQEDQLAEATDKAALIGDIVEHWQRLANGTQTLCFAVTIAHSVHIVEQFLAKGILAQHVDAYTPEFERRRIIRDFRDGKFQILSNCAMLAEGFDVPSCATMILARPTKSLIRYLQMIGRILRPHDGKERACVLDHSGSAKRLGFPTDELPLVLDDGKPKSATGEKRPEALLQKCSACHFLKPPRTPVCPRCGHKPEPLTHVETISGELQKMDRAASDRAGEKKQKAKINRGTEWDEKRAWYGGLLSYEAQRGHKPGWAAHRYKAKFGVWPNDARVKYAPPCPVLPEVARFIQSRNIAWAKSKAKQNAS